MSGAGVVMILVAKDFSLIRLSPVVGEMVKATDVVMMSVAKAFSLIWLSWVVGELGKATVVVKNTELNGLGVAAKLEFI